VDRDAWLAAARALVDRHPVAAALLAACVIAQAARDVGDVALREPLSTTWDHVLTVALDPRMTELPRDFSDEAARCVAEIGHLTADHRER
jgi:hypothetical protein